ncbi:UDP-2,3-diacylglucosamine diphosphatase LpxI [Pseudodesulfovibrio sp.]|uniref:LpxI family protein n=1 Tax=Pseudodesulfovibrio sp. TaxID=2035812 RepID=UPI00262725B0|nr:UDP-2,3-diacylglucosamine diphosphatase LpxI [Pseudodesulfovibrio sp.]MDD3310705.1 UDP-2,3-diacylglucosamine diphosphatase LpxI [Pseudodesulfovibrio sp.]
MGDSVTTIGLIAGGRQFPVMVARGVKAHGHRLVVAGFTGHTNMDVAPLADVWRELKLGKLGQLIDYFKQNGVQKVIMAGTINKPKVMDVRYLDMRAVKLLFRQKNKGDSAILGTLAGEFEREGMPVVPPQAFVPELLTPDGVLTRRGPDEREREDLRFAWNIAKDLGRLDIGQCLVVREGIVAAVEALEGTDATIRRGCELGGPACVVVKVFKPGQQEQVDLPSLGTDTIRAMAEGGATCLGVEAGKSLFFDRDEAVAVADRAGIAIVGLTDDDSAGT